jgi:signal transduction histidine kinase
MTMRERVELLGGTFALEPARPRGTTIRVVVPLKRQSAVARVSRGQVVAALPVAAPPAQTAR